MGDKVSPSCFVSDALSWLLFLYFSMEFVPKVVFLQELIVHGLLHQYYGAHPSGAYYSSANPHLHQLSQTCCSTAGLYSWTAVATWGLFLKDPSIVCSFLRVTRAAAQFIPPWWHVEICGLNGDILLLYGPLLVCRKLLIHTWSTSCSPSALTLVPSGLLLSELLLCSSLFLSIICSPRACPVLLMALL